jgi:glycosyltransferase involved in cell wall biosynthesis
LVTIVTPVYQMARFLPETIESVFAQDYPRIEYIVMDAGSTDGTLDILRRLEAVQPANVAFQWFSGPDKGTADAVNKGLARSKGSILAYLNADDTYAPGAIRSAIRALSSADSAGGVYGEANWVAEDGTIIGRYPTRPFDAAQLASECFICQPASFIRREVFEKTGGLDTSLRFAYDYDFWIRLAQRYRLLKIPEVLAASRMHAANKTLHQRRGVLRENIAILKRHYGYAAFRHVLAYAAHLVDRRDQFFAPFEPSFGKYLLALALGLGFNWRHPWRFTREWASAMSFGGLRRLLQK